MNKNLITKKILCLAILSILVITLTGCFSHTHKFIDGICECGAKQNLDYSINYNLNGGTLLDSVESFKDASEVVLSAPTKEGYEFLGWYEEKNGSKVKVDTLENRNYNLIAEWKKLNDNDIYSILESLKYQSYKVNVYYYEQSSYSTTTINYDLISTLLFGTNVIAVEKKITNDNYEGTDAFDYIVTENGNSYMHRAKFYSDGEIGYYTLPEEETGSGYNYYFEREYYIPNIDALSKYPISNDGPKYSIKATDQNEAYLDFAYPYYKESFGNIFVRWFDIEIKDNNIYRISINLMNKDISHYMYYIYEFSDYGNVSLNIDDVNDIVFGKYSTVSSTFTDVNFNTIDGPSYKSNIPGKSFLTNKGVQFMQKSGEVEIVSNTKYYNVRRVKITCMTNQDLGMNINVKVGRNYLYNGVEDVVKVSKSVNSQTYEFLNSSLVDGNITITMTPTAGDKSMFISSVEVLCGKVEFDKSVYMPTQVYDETKHSDKRMQDYLLDYNGAIGLSSTGTYDVLVIPIEFKLGSSFKQSELDKLDKAFNGTEADTGYESVKTYYQKSSYDKLNMSFDVVSPYKTKYNARYYNNYYEEVKYDNGDTGYQYGEEVILLEALRYYESILDLSKYDYNNDNVIDGVYLIYNHSIDYYDDESMFWAYTTWYTAPSDLNQTFDGLDAYYYMFAGYDFIEEDVKGGTVVNDVIDGLKVNATTFIHETGHMLGLDDYYDYYDDNGSDMGLGGVDIMDGNNGDHNAYSKIMMNWITPKIVTETQTITINPMSKSGDAILVPLDYNNSYMCEYLLIDLYTNDGLNEMQDSINNMYGTGFGVRIYHVSSSANKPYSDDYQSYTDNNNSSSDIPLIKLVEADGDKNFRGGYAQASDLWVKGQMLSSVYGKYARNDGKFVNFDIIIHEVSSNEAVITIEYYDM